MMESVQKRFPAVKAVATTMREVQSTNRHRWSAVLFLDGKGYQAPTCELDVYDRVGGGDGFASGLIYGLLEGKESTRGAQTRLGSWGPLDQLPRGYHHGDALSGRSTGPRRQCPYTEVKHAGTRIDGI